MVDCSLKRFRMTLSFVILFLFNNYTSTNTVICLHFVTVNNIRNTYTTGATCWTVARYYFFAPL